jgi:acyl phosphate:glycerol-3-phosphate acyltransferase
VTPALWLVASYLLGAISFSYLAGRIVKGIDLREHGSGNLGATNAFRVLGTRVAAPVMALDMLKGFVPVWYFPRWDGSPEWRWALAYGVAAIVGHVFSVYMRFRGGKGVATGAGVFLALAPVAVLAGLAVFILLVFATGMVSLGSLLAAFTVAIVLPFTESRPEVLALGWLVALFIVYAHRSNITRILRGEESRFGRRGGGTP